MNKLLIPTILTATVLIAGIFAFMPIEKASTVHASILAAAGITTVVAENVVLPTDGTNVIFTFTADSDSIVHTVQIDNTPTCNPTTAGVCTTSDEDFTPTLDGDTVDEPLCTTSVDENTDDSPDDASDDRYTVWQCDSTNFTLVFADITRTDGQLVPLQGISQAMGEDVGGDNQLAMRDMFRKIGKQTGLTSAIRDIPLQAGEKMSFVFELNCGPNPVIVDYFLTVTGSGTLDSAPVPGSSNNCA